MKKFIFSILFLSATYLSNGHTINGGVDIHLTIGLNATYSCGEDQTKKCISYGGLNVLYPGKEVIIHFPGGDQKGVVLSAQNGNTNTDGTVDEPTDIVFMINE